MYQEPVYREKKERKIDGKNINNYNNYKKERLVDIWFEKYLQRIVVLILSGSR